ncbi:hypothetical protein [Rhodopila sp.]|uniref:hypothetical protein n=1 Tax=Rhodopila sp. TaxID=2480087 RepID=UPI003D13802D
MSFIVAGCALLLALIASSLLDGRSACGERDAMSDPFGRCDVKPEAGSCFHDSECLSDGQ